MATYTLSEAKAAALWEHLLARQGLADHTRLETVAQISDAALGLHAARLPSPYGIIASRSTGAAVPTSLFTAPVQDTLLTVRCMRKTLHALPLGLAAIAHAATLRFRDRDARRAIVKAGLSEQTIAGAVDRLLALLADGPLGHRAIEQRLAQDGVGVPTGRLAIKRAWEGGQIVYRNATRVWNREKRTFAVASSIPGLNLGLDRDAAITALVTAYLDRYGPATVRDATWWSGLSATDILTGLAASGRELVRIRTPWAQADCLMFADRFEEFQASTPTATGVNLLAHEDTALKSYFQTRGRYLGDLPPRRAFNQIGEALPGIMINGRIVGTWEWNPTCRSVEVSLVRGRVSPADRKTIARRAEALTGTLRQGWASGTAQVSDVSVGQLAVTNSGG
ncbi:DNA glycosylase AlkZ-like family protein [Streptosporangium soli]|nr:winged helix DNA-binding domain-containing protein [Streptosporangium sp. KLBMP 9127]